MNSVIITDSIADEGKWANYVVSMKELQLQFHIDSLLEGSSYTQIFVIHDEDVTEPYVMWRGKTTMEALRLLEDTHLEQIGFMYDQTVFANKMWDDIQNMSDWKEIPGVVDAPESDDLDDWTEQTTKAQMAYIKEKMIEKFGQYSIFDYDNVDGEVK